MSANLVVADATAYGPGPSGSKHRFLEVLPRVAALRPDDVFEVHWAGLVANPPDSAWPDNVVHAVVEGWRGQGVQRWTRRSLGLRRRHRAAAFTHLLVDHGPLPPLPGVRGVVTVHDLRFLRGWGGRLRGLYGRYVYGRVLARASAILAVSDTVAAEIAAVWPSVADRIAIARNAPSPRFTPLASPARKRELLLVARDEPRKARGAAETVAREAGWPLRVIGGDATERELLAAYGQATWLLAPSLEEGYDLPVVEALACGTPVIASGIDAHRELQARGAAGLVLCYAPTRERGAWSWPGAVARLAEAPPTLVAPPPDRWDDTARVVVEALFSDRSGERVSP